MCKRPSGRHWSMQGRAQASGSRHWRDGFCAMGRFSYYILAVTAKIEQLLCTCVLKDKYGIKIHFGNHSAWRIWIENALHLQTAIFVLRTAHSWVLLLLHLYTAEFRMLQHPSTEEEYCLMFLMVHAFTWQWWFWKLWCFIVQMCTWRGDNICFSVLVCNFGPYGL